MKYRRSLVLVCISVMMFALAACGNNSVEDTQKETQSEQVESEQENTEPTETETEVKVEFETANDILTMVWEKYEVADTDGNPYNDRFYLMGGHFESAVMDMPAAYDLTKTEDLELMFCVPADAIPMIDEAATMIHLMKATTFTGGAYHVADVANLATVVDGMKQQILANHWLDGFPDMYVIAVVDEQYVVSAIGDSQVVEHFISSLSEIFGKQVTVQVQENIR